MQAIVINHAGGPEALQLQEVPTPQVKPGWSLVKVKGFGINHSEIYTRKGESPSVHFPRILGIECVGEIAETTAPDQLPVGQRVVSLMGGMGREFDGGYAEYALLPNEQLYPVATKLSWAELAAVPETYFTAFGSLQHAHITEATALLIRGATSGVGVAAIKLAKAMNPAVTVSGSTRRQAKFAELQAIGCDHPVLDEAGHLPAANRYDAIVELVGAKTLQDSLAHLLPGGYCCVTGGLGDQWTVPDFDPFALPNGASLTNFESGAAINGPAFNALLQLIDQHHIDVAPRQTFDLAHTADAQAALEASDSFGKVVVLV
ncbi:alcohol dehydrogenase catalytic domain-containing protein [Lacticaseibacillus baoqingensis]|uniref:Alcohol dehydrogenase catalytic domain-containing protein n=1 Tax=Lacticaseibacillus baoqingensis TaxID=2486013 RepID=A0ABW4E4T2_9LACO|nr:zinc-binding dehydrogenase [Lacticaseibacillus baoqingensis]